MYILNLCYTCFPTFDEHSVALEYAIKISLGDYDKKKK